MHRLERTLLVVLLSGVAPLLGLLIGWWGAVPFLPEGRIWLPTLAGFVAGIIVDVLWVRRWVRAAGRTSWRRWAIAGAAIYSFYAVGVYGFFMGVPIFNAGLAVPAALLLGCRLAGHQQDSRTAARAASMLCGFVTAVLGLLCVASAILALSDASTAANLEGMLALPFTVTQPMIVGLVVVGGAGLLGFQAWLTVWITRQAYRWTLRHPSLAQ